jgi:translation initiation factor 2B subunit (eIF-2B alpha/beta/delta family)
MLDKQSSRIQAVIREIAADNTSGAAEILRRCAAVFSLLQQENQSSTSVGQAREAVTTTCLGLVNAQPDMSSLLRLASEALKAARTQTSGQKAIAGAADAAIAFVESASVAAQAAASHGALLIREGATVLTHSRSSTVLDAFLAARRNGTFFEVIATESRPMFEGRKLAEQLVSAKIKVVVIADAAASLFLKRADTVLVGADKITPNDVVNKTGTEMIALAARERGVAAYAICDSSKFVSTDYMPDSNRDQDAGELWLDAPREVSVVNRYFEATPLEYFTSIVTEHGLLSATEASALARDTYVDRELNETIRGIR